MVYEWKISMPVDAQIAGEELERIESEHNSLTPEVVLEESRAENSVLHKCFEWNDTIAAEKYRVEQARYIIRNIIVKVESPVRDDLPKEIKIRGYVNVSENQKGEYVKITTALSNDDYRARVLKNALAELRMFQNKYSIYAELAGVCKAIDEFAAILS